MSVTINVYEYFEVTFDDGEVKEGGSRTVANTISADGEVLERKLSLDDGDSAALWDDSDSALSDFDFLWIETDTDCDIEISNNSGAEMHSFTLSSSTPFILGRDDADAIDITASDVADQIDEINVRGLTDGTNVRMVLIT